MTSPWRGNSEPSEPKHDAASYLAEDDDLLIDKLRARAWDPGLRFDTADVPVAWIEERFGRQGREQAQGRARSRSSAGTIALKAHDEVVASYFASAAREPLFSPVASGDVEAAERVIGRPLPDLLRRIYTEVGNGGFGPDAGLASLTAGLRAPRHVTDWPCSVDIHQRTRGQGVPASWLYLTSGGCSMEWHVSLLAANNPVLLYDADGWEPTWGQDPHDGLRYATASLRQWWWTWVSGGEVWADALKAAAPVSDPAVGQP